MELFFTNNEFTINQQKMSGIPFLVDNEMKLIESANQYLFYIAVTNGRTESPKTWETYGRNISDFFNWLEVQGLEWASVREQHIGAYRSSMVITKSALTGRPNSSSTINQRLGQVVRFYEYMFRRGRVSYLPFSMSDVKLRGTGGLLAHTGSKKIKTADIMLKVHDSLPKYMTLADAKKFITIGLNTERARLMAKVMLQSGMRRSEVTLLPNVLIEKAEKDASVIEDGKPIPINLPAEICKGKKKRTILISKQLLNQLRQYRVLIRPSLNKIYKNKYGMNSERFWLSEFGKELSVNCLNRDFIAASKKSGIQCTPHMLRHTFATVFYSKTNDIRSLQKLLGHSSLTTTQIYEHTVPEDRLGFMDDFQNEIDLLFSIGGN